VKVARFVDPSGAERCGMVDGAHVHEFAGVRSFTDWLAAGSTSTPPIGRSRPLSELRLLPPISPHAKVFCVGYNYAAHGAEMSRETPQRPTLFVRFADSFVGAGQAVVRPPESVELDWEGEVGVVIGLGGRRIGRRDAYRHIAGYTAVAENSVRDWQFHSTQSTAGKNWADSGACGPWLCTADEVGTSELRLQTRLNGDVVQRGSTADLVFDIAALIEYISTFTALRPGDLIATGTPAGVGYRQEPRRFLRHGDQLSVAVDKVGVLVNEVIDEVAEATHSGSEAGAR
jgi:2-keto-4-pentenoate hydratase/2-oxohepta-3-ene-1,7-dioic acid hydratase in catechol pathway